ncbi:MAG: iron complex transport system ATP-binding protein [Flavobacteriales bacterium]|jgi:iron complex transport system ATP-binding protein
MLELKDLTTGYNGKPLHRSFSTSAKAGELIILAGRNGAGKSTLIRNLAGFLRPITGAIEINSENLSALSIAQRAKVLSIVQTSISVWTDLTVLEIMELGASVNSPWPTTKEITRAVERFNLTAVLHSKLEQISDGERQKTMIVRALLQNTQIILMDEPSAFLDYPSKLELWKGIELLKNEGRTVIVCSHDLSTLSELQVIDRYWVFTKDQILDIKAPLPLSKLMELME